MTTAVTILAFALVGALTLLYLEMRARREAETALVHSRQRSKAIMQAAETAIDCALLINEGHQAKHASEHRRLELAESANALLTAENQRLEAEADKRRRKPARQPAVPVG